MMSVMFMDYRKIDLSLFTWFFIIKVLCIPFLSTIGNFLSRNGIYTVTFEV